jgi:hypothetical protein
MKTILDRDSDKLRINVHAGFRIKRRRCDARDKTLRHAELRALESPDDRLGPRHVDVSLSAVPIVIANKSERDTNEGGNDEKFCLKFNFERNFFCCLLSPRSAVAFKGPRETISSGKLVQTRARAH